MNSLTYTLWIQISLGLWICCPTGVFCNEDKSRRKVIDNLLKNPSKDETGIDEVGKDWIRKEEQSRAKEEKRHEKKLESEDNDVPDIWERIQSVFGGKYYVISIIGIVAFLAVSCALHALLIKLLMDKYSDSEDKTAKNKKKLTRQEKRQLSRIFSGRIPNEKNPQESTVPLLSHNSSKTRTHHYELPQQSSDRHSKRILPQGQRILQKMVPSSSISSSSPKREMNQKQIQVQRQSSRITKSNESKEYNSPMVNKDKNFSNVQSREVDAKPTSVRVTKNRHYFI